MSVNWKRAAASVAATALMLVAVGCGSDDEAAGDPKSDAPVRVAWIGPQSGPAGPLGTAQLEGMKLAAEDINADGGILGRQIQVTAEDAGIDPAKAVSLLQKTLAGEAPDLVYPGLSSSTANALLPLTTQRKILTFSPASAASLTDPKKYPLHHSLGANFEETFVTRLADQMAQAGVKTVAALFAEDEAGQSYQAAWEKQLERVGIEIAAQTTFAPDAVDLSAPVARLRKSGADALVFEAIGRPAFGVLGAVQASKWDVPIYTISTGNLTYDGQISDAVLDNVTLGYYSIASEDFGSADPEQAEAFRKRLAATGVDLATTDMWLAATGWDLLWIYKAAVEAADSFEGAKVDEVLRSKKFPKSDGPWLAFDYAWSTATNEVIPGEADVDITSIKKNKDGLHVAPAGS